MKKLFVLFILLGVASCSSDDAAPAYNPVATGAMSLKIDNVLYNIDNPVVEVQGQFANFTAAMDGSVYFTGTTEVRYAVHMILEQHSGSFSVTGYDLMVKEETGGGYSVKNYHAFADGTAISDWMQSGNTSNMYHPQKKTDASGEFSGYVSENGAPAQEEVYISGEYSLHIK